MPNGNEILMILEAQDKQFKATMDDVKKQIDGISKKSKEASKESEGFFKNLRRFVSIAVIGQLARVTGEFAKMAGEIDTVERTFRNMVDGAGKSSSALLQSVRQATRGTVSNLDIMRNTNLAIGLMGDQVIDKIPKLAKIAAGAARQQGTSVAKMLEDIIVASGRRSVQILDNLGISSVEAAKKQEIFARSIGKTRAQLNEAEKSQAFFFAVVEAGSEIVAKTGSNALTLGEKIQVVTANVKNSAAAFTKEMNPALNSLTNLFIEATEEGGLLNSVMVLMGKIFNVVGKSMAFAALKVKEFMLNFARRGAIEAVKSYKDRLNELNGQLRDLQTGPQVPGDKENTKRVQEIQKEITKYRNLVKETNKDFVDLGSEQTKVVNELLKLGKEQTDQEVKRRRMRQQALAQQRKGTGAARLRVSEVLGFAGETREAELAKLDEQTAELQKKWRGHTDKLQIINEAHDRKRREIFLKFDTFRNSIMTGFEQSGVNAMKNFENATKSSLKEALDGGNGWKAFGKAVEDIVKNLIADLIVAIGRALVLRTVVGATTGTGAAGGLVPLTPGIFKKGRIPSFQDGRVPADHELAFVGRREAIINAQSTAANAKLLQAINNSNGQAVSAGDTINISITGNNFRNQGDIDHTVNRLVESFEIEGRHRGKKLFS